LFERKNFTLCWMEELPRESQQRINAQITLNSLPQLLIVSMQIRTAALLTLSNLETFNFVLEDGKTCSPDLLSAILHHCHGLRKINGLVLSSKKAKSLENSSPCSRARVHHTMSMFTLFHILHNNPFVETLVLYDHHVMCPKYLSSLLETVRSSCPSLKTLYSEASEGEESAIAEFLEMSSLQEVAFPNTRARKVLSEKNWTGMFSSQYGLRHSATNLPILVWHRHAPAEAGPSGSPLYPRASRLEASIPIRRTNGRQSVLAQSRRPNDRNAFVIPVCRNPALSGQPTAIPDEKEVAFARA